MHACMHARVVSRIAMHATVYVMITIDVGVLLQKKYRVKRGRVLPGLRWISNEKYTWFSPRNGNSAPENQGKVTPFLDIQASTVNDPYAGLGLFAAEDHPEAGIYMSPYDGVEWHRRLAEHFLLDGKGTHLLTMGNGSNAVLLDGKPVPGHPNRSIEWYVKTRAVAQFANTHPSLKEKNNNARFVTHTERGYQPYYGAPIPLPHCCVACVHARVPHNACDSCFSALLSSSAASADIVVVFLEAGYRYARTYIVTTKPLKAGDEIFVWYSKNHAQMIEDEAQLALDMAQKALIVSTRSLHREPAAPHLQVALRLAQDALDQAIAALDARA
jgi:hypothetical protein